MARDIDEQLSAYNEKDYTVRLCKAVFKVIPPAPELAPYSDMEGAAVALNIQAGPQAIARARELAAGEGPQAVLWMANILDNTDSGLSIYSGVRSAVKLYKSRKTEESASSALSTDNQQAADAVLKGLGVAYMIHKLYPGGPTEKLEKIRSLPSGEALLYYYAAVEVGLPFADNALLKGGEILDDLFEKLGGAQQERLAAVAGADKVAEAQGMMSGMLAPMQGMVNSAAAYLGPLATTASETLPKAMDVADKVAGAVAAGADLLPVYRYMGARLVAEACLNQAVAEIGPEVAAAAPAAEAPAAASPTPAPTPAAKPAPTPAATPAPIEEKGGSMIPKIIAVAVLGLSLAVFGLFGLGFFAGSATSGDEAAETTSEDNTTSEPSRSGKGTKSATRGGKR